MVKYLTIIVPLFCSLQLFSQENRLAGIITSVAEEMAENENEPMLEEVYSDMLYELSENRVRINSGDEKEIRRLFFLSEFKVRILSDYVRETGAVNSLAEIANIPGFDRETAEMMAPFITLDKVNSTLTASSKISNILLSNFVFKPGTKDPTAPGSPIKMLIRYKFTSGKLSAGVTSEKDPGEKLFYLNPPGTDFLSAYFSYSGNGIIKRIVAGDFSVRSGLGTSVNTGLRTGFSLTSPGNLSGGNEIRPYTSTDENNYFRGLAAVLEIKNVEMSLFLSENKIDATLYEPGDSSMIYVKSIYKTGYHDSGSSLGKKDVLNESSLGLTLSYNFRNIRTGISFAGNNFSLPFLPDSDDPGNLYDFQGSASTICSIYYNALLRKIHLSGEVSATNQNGLALVQILTFRPSDRLNICFLYRTYSARYFTFHGRGPGIGTTDNNENGIAGSFTFETSKYLFISAGCDIRNHPWISYSSSYPSTAIRYELRVKYLPSEKLNIESLYIYRSSLSDGMTVSGMPAAAESHDQSIRIQARYIPSEFLTLSTRIDFREINPASSQGISLLQDIAFRFPKTPLSLWIRYCIFNTDDYASGIYTWENDLLNSFSIPVLYGNGIRNYAVIKWEPTRYCEIRAKYGFTSVKRDKNREDYQDDVKFQLILRF